MNRVFIWWLLIVSGYAIAKGLWIEFRYREDQKVIWGPWDAVLAKVRQDRGKNFSRYSEEIEVLRDKLHARQRDTWSANPFRWLICMYRERRKRC